jgi:hypothetical protein
VHAYKQRTIGLELLEGSTTYVQASEVCTPRSRVPPGGFGPGVFHQGGGPVYCGSSAGVGHLGWEDSGLAFDQVAVLKPLVIQSRQGCEEPSDNAGAASALKHQRTQALQGALEAPEPWRLHWLQRNVARGRPQSATQPASQTRALLTRAVWPPVEPSDVSLLVMTRLPRRGPP